MNELSSELREYLKRCGVSQKDIARCDENTRLYHDLGIYGDVAEADMELLAREYQVDMSRFEFDKFFPQEFPGKTPLTRILLWLAPFASNAARRRGDYEPLPLKKIERAIYTKQWNGEP